MLLLHIITERITEDNPFGLSEGKVKLMRKRKNVYNATLDLNWSNTYSEEQQRSEWLSASNILWNMEKEGQITKKELENAIPEYMKKENYPRKDIMKMKSVRDYDKTVSFCITAYLLNKGYDYSPSKEYMNNTIQSLVNKKYEKVTVTRSKPVKIDSFTVMLELIESLETNITAKVTDFTKEFANKGCSTEVAKRLHSIYEPLYIEYTEAYSGNKEVLEGYSQYNKRDFKILCKWYKALLETLEEIQKKKVSTTVRKSKPKTPSQLVKKLKYMKKFDELSLTSFNPEYIIGAKCVTLYNTKTRVFTVLIGNSLSVTGTTIQNFDDEKSFSKVLRTPFQQLKKLTEGTKLRILKEFEEINTKGKLPSGRVNDQMILVSVYKK
jgi:hypothetical protein